MRILIAEDEWLIALLLTDLLEEMGHNVCAAVVTEAQAIFAATVYRPDLIIADVYLHDGSGVQAIRNILQFGFVPHLFMTGNPFQLSIDPGAIVVKKPFTVPALTWAIGRALKPIMPARPD